MQFVMGHIEVIVTATLVVAAAALVVGVVAFLQVRTLRYPFKSMASIYQKDGAEKALSELLKGVDENRNFIKQNASGLSELAARLRKSYSAFGLVKYNAFEDIGGNQSYSFCLLNEERNGVIFTNLVGRNSTRGYALEIKEGVPSRELSEEERRALDEALKQLAG